jgi:hypothetical protein
LTKAPNIVIPSSSVTKVTNILNGDDVGSLKSAITSVTANTLKDQTANKTSAIPTANVATSSNIIIGKNNSILGSNNTIEGNLNKATGTQLDITGDLNTIKGVNTTVIGSNNTQTKGRDNIIYGGSNAL